MEGRLPAHLEVSGFLRSVNAAGGFATVLHKGEPDSGTILIVLTNSSHQARLFERMPSMDNDREWQCTRTQDPEKPNEFNDYIERRCSQDSDIWVIELDIPDGERFIL